MSITYWRTIGSFVIAAIEEIGADKMAAVVKSTATCCVERVASIARLFQNETHETTRPIS